MARGTVFPDAHLPSPQGGLIEAEASFTDHNLSPSSDSRCSGKLLTFIVGLQSLRAGQTASPPSITPLPLTLPPPLPPTPSLPPSSLSHPPLHKVLPAVPRGGEGARHSEAHPCCPGVHGRRQGLRRGVPRPLGAARPPRAAQPTLLGSLLKCVPDQRSLEGHPAICSLMYSQLPGQGPLLFPEGPMVACVGKHPASWGDPPRLARHFSTHMCPNI